MKKSQKQLDNIIQEKREITARKDKIEGEMQNIADTNVINSRRIAQMQEQSDRIKELIDNKGANKEADLQNIDAIVYPQDPLVVK